jgi:hypothetical protein
MLERQKEKKEQKDWSRWSMISRRQHDTATEIMRYMR